MTGKNCWTTSAKFIKRTEKSEQPFALLETETIRKIYQDAPVGSIIAALDPAFHAFNSARKRNLTLHPQVRESLEILKAANIRLIAHTESKLYGVVDRLSRLNLFPYFTKVYCRERSLSSHPMPRSGVEWLDQFPMDKIIELSHHQKKPNPAVLLEICSNEGIGPELAAYVGDSVARDVLMAKRANVFAIWAAYGAQHPPVMYGDLVRSLSLDGRRNCSGRNFEGTGEKYQTRLYSPKFLCGGCSCSGYQEHGKGTSAFSHLINGSPISASASNKEKQGIDGALHRHQHEPSRRAGRRLLQQTRDVRASPSRWPRSPSHGKCSRRFCS